MLHNMLVAKVTNTQCVSCSKQIQISSMHTSRWLRLHLFFGIILIDGVYS